MKKKKENWFVEAFMNQTRKYDVDKDVCEADREVDFKKIHKNCKFFKTDWDKGDRHRKWFAYYDKRIWDSNLKMAKFLGFKYYPKIDMGTSQSDPRFSHVGEKHKYSLDRSPINRRGARYYREVVVSPLGYLLPECEKDVSAMMSVKELSSVEEIISKTPGLEEERGWDWSWISRDISSARWDITPSTLYYLDHNEKTYESVGFHKKWSWLIPVIQTIQWHMDNFKDPISEKKIGKRHKLYKSLENCRSVLNEALISMNFSYCYMASVEFIDFYNEAILEPTIKKERLVTLNNRMKKVMNVFMEINGEIADNVIESDAFLAKSLTNEADLYKDMIKLFQEHRKLNK